MVGFGGRIGIALLTLTVILRLGGVVMAADYSADIVREENGRESFGKVFVADKKIRMEMTTQGQEMVTLINLETEKAYLVRPQAKIFVEKSMGTIRAVILMTEEALGIIGRVEKLGRETLAGFECDKLKVVYNNKQNGEALVWRSPVLDLPLKVVSESERGKVTTRYENIIFSVPKNVGFDPPAGFNQLVPRLAPAGEKQ